MSEQPEYTALTDLAAVKALVFQPGSTSNTNSDALFTSLISAVSAAISNYCNRNFGVQSYTEVYNGPGTTQLWLRQRPIQSVSSVSVLGATIPQRPGTGGYGWSYDNNVLYLSGAAWPDTDCPQCITVSYTAGLTVSASATPDLWQAAAEWVFAEYKNLAHLELGSQSAGEGQSTVYLRDMPWTVRKVVDLYRQVAVEGQVLGN